MRLKKVDISTLVEGVSETPEVIGFLSSSAEISNSQLYSHLKNLAQESLVFIFAKSDYKMVRQRIIHYLSSLRDIKLSVTGYDVIQEGFRPSPAFALALEAALNAKLDGFLKSREEELAFAKEKVKILEKDRGD